MLFIWDFTIKSHYIMFMRMHGGDPKTLDGHWTNMADISSIYVDHMPVRANPLSLFCIWQYSPSFYLRDDGASFMFTQHGSCSVTTAEYDAWLVTLKKVHHHFSLFLICFLWGFILLTPHPAPWRPIWDSSSPHQLDVLPDSPRIQSLASLSTLGLFEKVQKSRCERFQCNMAMYCIHNTSLGCLSWKLPFENRQIKVYNPPRCQYQDHVLTIPSKDHLIIFLPGLALTIVDCFLISTTWDSHLQHVRTHAPASKSLETLTPPLPSTWR